MRTSELAGQRVLITGANSGIGVFTARDLADRGATVIFAGRSEARTRPVMSDIATSTGNDKLEFLPCDLGSLQSVRDAADAFCRSDRPLHLLINNAGLGGARGLTADGFELAFGTNHLGPFLLTERLRGHLVAGSRIVNVASKAHFQAKGIDLPQMRSVTPSLKGMSEYAVSKLANVLHASALAEQLKGRGVGAFSLHPGVVGTNIWELGMGKTLAKVVGFFMMSSEEGARTTIHCATAPGLEAHSGAYFDKCAPVKASRLARDKALEQALWDYSAEAVAPFNRD